MAGKENKKKDAFRQVDKNMRGGRMDDTTREDLKEKGDEHSDAI